MTLLNKLYLVRVFKLSAPFTNKTPVPNELLCEELCQQSKTETE